MQVVPPEHRNLLRVRDDVHQGHHDEVCCGGLGDEPGTERRKDEQRRHEEPVEVGLPQRRTRLAARVEPEVPVHARVAALVGVPRVALRLVRAPVAGGHGVHRWVARRHLQTGAGDVREALPHRHRLLQRIVRLHDVKAGLRERHLQVCLDAIRPLVHLPPAPFVGARAAVPGRPVEADRAVALVDGNRAHVRGGPERACLAEHQPLDVGVGAPRAQRARPRHRVPREHAQRALRARHRVEAGADAAHGARLAHAQARARGAERVRLGDETGRALHVNRQRRAVRNQRPVARAHRVRLGPDAVRERRRHVIRLERAPHDRDAAQCQRRRVYFVRRPPERVQPREKAPFLLLRTALAAQVHGEVDVVGVGDDDGNRRHVGVGERVDVFVSVHDRVDARVLQHRHVVHGAHVDGHRVRVQGTLRIARGLQPEHERVVPVEVGVRRVPEKRVPGGVRARRRVGGFGAAAQNLNLAVRRGGDDFVTQRG